VQNADWNDSELRADYVRGHAGTQYHLAGTASLGSVVDSSLRVFGVDGLRVIDASVFAMHVSGNIQVTFYAIAEKLADITQEDRAEKDKPHPSGFVVDLGAVSCKRFM
jgi:choline dehydrogenase-like flavoprotein